MQKLKSRKVFLFILVVAMAIAVPAAAFAGSGNYSSYRKTVSNDSYQYPSKLICTNGKSIPIPKQSHSSSDFIRHHGCSLIGMYEGLRWCDKNWSVNDVLKYARSNMNCHIKYTVRDCAKHMNKILPGSPAVYKESISKDGLNECLKKGYLVIYEEKDPIHTVGLVWDGAHSRFLRISGSVETTTLNHELSKRCTNATYRGCIVVKKVN